MKMSAFLNRHVNEWLGCNMPRKVMQYFFCEHTLLGISALVPDNKLSSFYWTSVLNITLVAGKENYQKRQVSLPTFVGFKPTLQERMVVPTSRYCLSRTFFSQCKKSSYNMSFLLRWYNKAIEKHVFFTKTNDLIFLESEEKFLSVEHAQYWDAFQTATAERPWVVRGSRCSMKE